MDREGFNYRKNITLVRPFVRKLVTGVPVDGYTNFQIQILTICAQLSIYGE
jgi:hypothetical protein